LKAKSTKPQLSLGLRKLAISLALLSFFTNISGKLFWTFERRRALLADRLENEVNAS